MGERSTRTSRFVQVDVFTDRLFGGNPLAVFLDGTGLTDGAMQAIAAEMNLSETTFVLPPTRPGCAAGVRIFTPTRELPFAGHPTIGTTWVLATEGRLPEGARETALDEAIGPVPVRLEGPLRRPDLIWMQHPPAGFGEPREDRAAVARALGLTGDDLLPGAPIRRGSTGVPFLYVPLRGRAEVDRAVPNGAALAALPGADETAGVFLFALDGEPSAGRVYSRMFAPHTLGIPEDPATGAASGPLGAYLVGEGLIGFASNGRIVSEQGTKMGRPSFVHIRVTAPAAGELSVEIGGAVVPVLTGELHLPA